MKDEGEFSGKIVIKSKNSQFKVQIPYRAFLVRGQLVVNNTATQFHLKTKTSAGIQRNLTVRLKISLLGVDSLWGDCMFISADWGS